MAREKMFDPAFQKAFTEAIIKENKIRASNFLEDASGFPKSARVDFGADYDSDESDQEKEIVELQKGMEEERKSCELKFADGNKHKETSPEASDSKPLSQYPSIQRKGREEPTKEAEYIFPVCAFCDFGWKYNSRNYVVCPRHGPFRRGRFGYSRPIREYLLDQIHRNAQCEKDKKSRPPKLSNNFYLR